MFDLGPLSKHLIFLSVLLFYLIPTILGSAISFYVRSIIPKEESDENGEASKKIDKVSGRTVFFAGLVPALLLTSLDRFLRSAFDDTNLIIGLSFVIGCMGYEILCALGSTRIILRILKILTITILKAKKFMGENDDDINEFVNKIFGDDSGHKEPKSPENNKVPKENNEDQ